MEAAGEATSIDALPDGVLQFILGKLLLKQRCGGGLRFPSSRSSPRLPQLPPTNAL